MEPSGINRLVADVQEGLTQVPTATLLAAFSISSARAWAGVFQLRVLRGLSFMSFAMASRSRWVNWRRSAPLGRTWREAGHWCFRLIRAASGHGGHRTRCRCSTGGQVRDGRPSRRPGHRSGCSVRSAGRRFLWRVKPSRAAAAPLPSIFARVTAMSCVRRACRPRSGWMPP